MTLLLEGKKGEVTTTSGARERDDVALLDSRADADRHHGTAPVGHGGASTDDER